MLCAVILLNTAVGCHGIHDVLHFGAVGYTDKLCHVRAVLRALNSCPQHHRMVWEGTFKIHHIQFLHHGQGHRSLNQVTQRPIHPGLEHVQGMDVSRGTHNVSGQ